MDTIDEIISKEAYDQVDRMGKDLLNLKEIILDVVKASKENEVGFKGAKDYATMIQYLNEFNKVQERTIALNKQAQDVVERKRQADEAAATQQEKFAKKNLTQIDFEIAKQKEASASANQQIQSRMKQEAAAQKQREDFAKRNLNAYDFEIAKQEEASKAFSQALQQQIRERAQAEQEMQAQSAKSNLGTNISDLKVQIDANNQLAASYRAAAQEQQKLAASETDIIQKASFEANVRDNLQAAIKAEIANKDLLANADKRVADGAKQLISIENRLNAEKDKLAAATDREAQKAAKASSAYEQLKSEYNQAATATKELAAQYVIAQRNGSKTTAELEAMRNELVANQKATIGQFNTLLQLEQAVGQSQRAVGAYAYATQNITQVLQELPNFAINARTGILSLSNNIPQLIASLKTLSETIDVNTGKAVGMKGALKVLGASIFSWQTLIIVAISVLIKYQDQIADFINQTTAAEKAQRDYTDSLKDANKEVSGEIATLLIANATLNSNIGSRKDLIATLAEIKDSMGDYLITLADEGASTNELNDIIERRIELLKQSSEKEAARKTAQKSVEELTEAEEKYTKALSGEVGFWDRVKAAIAGTYPEQEAIASAHNDVTEAQEKLNASLRLANGIYDEQIKELEKRKSRLQDDLNLTDAQWRSYGYTNEEIANEIQLRKDQIAQIDEVIKKKKEEANIKPTDFKNQHDVDAEYYSAMAKQFKQYTSEQKKYLKEEENERYQSKLISLKKEYLAQGHYNEENLKDSKQYNEELETLRYNHEAELQSIEEAHAKKRTQKGKDYTNDLLNAEKEYDKAYADLQKQRDDTAMAANEKIFNDETKSLKERLDAYQDYVNAKGDKEYVDYISTYNNLARELQATKDQMKKVKDTTSMHYQALSIKKKALTVELENIEEQHQDKILEIQDESAKKQIEIVKSDTENKIKTINEGYRLLQAGSDAELAMELRNLQEKKDKGLLTDKEYYRQRQLLQSTQSRALFDKEYDYVKNLYDKIINDPSIPQAIKDAVLKLYGQLEQIRPSPRTVESKSILQYLGFDPNSTQKELQRLEDDLEKVKNKFAGDSVLGLDTSKDIAQIENLQKSIDYLQKTTIEDAKNALASQLKEFATTLYSTIESLRDSYYQKRFDQLDEEKNKIEQNAQAEKDAIDSSLLSQDEKQKKEHEIDVRAQAQETALDNKRKALQKQQAIAAKRDAIFKAELEAGVAVAKAFSQYPYPYSLIIAGLIVATTAANIAAIASQPIPEYFRGTENHIGGLAKIGERGRELVELPSGQMFLSPDKETIADLPKGTKVKTHGETETMLNKIREGSRQLYETLVNHAASDTKITPDFGNWNRIFLQQGIRQTEQLKAMEDVVQNNMDAMYIGSKIDSLQRAILNKKETHFYWDNGELKKSYKIGNTTIKYVNGMKGEG